jgi:CrcB protein
MNLTFLASVAAGGAIGASLRYMVAVKAAALFGAGFPWATLFVNIVGSFVMGLVFEFFAERLTPSAVQLFLMTGVLGGFTTFSAYSLEIVSMLGNRDYLTAGLYATGSVVVSALALFAGLYLVRVSLP